ncbi:MAG TPA: electron transport complex subunit RsxG [Gammaproteobacteria bacterium]|jgi:electron transport complex protein RnfG
MADRPSNAAALALVVVVTAIAGLLISVSHELSRERIEENRRARLRDTLHQVIDPASHDNDLEASRRLVVAPDLLGTSGRVEVFVASLRGRPVAALFATVAPRGYSGPIQLLVGVAADGSLTGVRVLSHRETPGLGDAIEIGKSAWIEGFRGASLADPAPADWAISKHGGEFDSITGATVTPTAVIEAVRDTLIYFRDHKDELFSAELDGDAGTNE